MIQDQAALSKIRESWRTVRTIEAEMESNLNAGLFSLVPKATGFSRYAESLLLLFAVSVLEDALKQLRVERVFRSRGDSLGLMMEESKEILPWVNYADVYAVKERRNSIAHDRMFLRSGECSQSLVVIAVELLAWGGLENDYRGSCTISIQPT